MDPSSSPFILPIVVPIPRSLIPYQAPESCSGNHGALPGPGAGRADALFRAVAGARLGGSSRRRSGRED